MQSESIAENTLVDNCSAGDCNLRNRPLLLRINGKLYDVALFAEKHPGGQQILRRLEGEDVSDYMNGMKNINGIKHIHSKAAYRMLERYCVEDQYNETDDLLSNEPMLKKVGNLGDRYWTWIHQPYEGSLRLFESNILESMTRTSWWVVPLVWMPFVIAITVRAFSIVFLDYGFLYGLLFWAVFFTLGVLMWTLLEYLLHRCIFHWQPSPKSRFQITLHFLLHGLHHKTPLDSDRLVFPPIPACFFFSFLYFMFDQLLPYDLFYCFGGGSLFGYIMYDCLHYYLHHADPLPGTSLHYRKVYHNNHHFKNSDLGLFLSNFNVILLFLCML
ncbi:unnamed protein product [Thelazia callipaeda]|uniref:Fatty acid 2-hydroxylase n=1 Tax=Thelazia callipaeda TaxID=103827 RepID=A0A0N5D0I7_THECL|nr:unnamed protein product [Thelazia callipaeda]